MGRPVRMKFRMCRNMAPSLQLGISSISRISRIVSREEIVEDSAVSANINIWTRGEAEWRIKIARGDQNLQPCSRTLMVCGGGYWWRMSQMGTYCGAPVLILTCLWSSAAWACRALSGCCRWTSWTASSRGTCDHIIIEYAQSKIKHLDSKCIS